MAGIETRNCNHGHLWWTRLQLETEEGVVEAEVEVDGLIQAVERMDIDPPSNLRQSLWTVCVLKLQTGTCNGMLSCFR